MRAADVYREGHRRRHDRRHGERRGPWAATVKLLAIAERAPTEAGISVRVHPAMIPLSHPLAGVREAYNAVFVEAEAAGSLMFYGRGAGGAPTASAVLGDLVAVARNRLTGGRGRRGVGVRQSAGAADGRTITRYHVTLDVADKAGVLAVVARRSRRTT